MKNAKQIHQDLQSKHFESLFNVKSNSGLESFIGEKAKFKSWNRNMGTAAKNEVYVIGSVQKIHDGSFAFRVYATSINDTFGRCMTPNECLLITK